MDPHSVSWIGHPPVGKSIRKQEVTEFIVPGRLGNGQDGLEGGSNREGRKSHNRHGEPPLLR